MKLKNVLTSPLKMVLLVIPPLMWSVKTTRVNGVDPLLVCGPVSRIKGLIYSGKLLQERRFLFVTSFYDFGSRSKHSGSAYETWMRRLFKIFHGEIFFFTNDEIASKYSRMTGDTIHFIYQAACN